MLDRRSRLMEAIGASVVATAVVLAVAEIGAWAFLKFWPGAETHAARISPDQMAIYRQMMPALSEAEIEQVFFGVPYHVTYAPWIEFASPDMSYPHVNVRDHARATVPEFSSSRDGALVVFFFGGSTMFGYHVADDATLPSAFTAEAARDQSLSFHATNFGDFHYYLKHEAMLFTSMLLDGRKPRVAVFLDGLNDLIGAGASYARAPFFSRAMQWMFDQPAENITLRGLIARTSLGQLRLGRWDRRTIWESVPGEMRE
jgi:hypothetical protein